MLLHNDWRLGLVSLTVLPFVLAPTARLGRRIRRTTRRAQDDTAELTRKNRTLEELNELKAATPVQAASPAAR